MIDYNLGFTLGFEYEFYNMNNNVIMRDWFYLQSCRPKGFDHSAMAVSGFLGLAVVISSVVCCGLPIFSDSFAYRSQTQRGGETY